MLPSLPTFLLILSSLSSLIAALPTPAPQTQPRQKCLYTCPPHDHLLTTNDHSIESSQRLDCGYEESGVCAYDLTTGHLRRDLTSSNGRLGLNCPPRASTRCWDSPRPVVLVRRAPSPEPVWGEFELEDAGYARSDEGTEELAAGVWRRELEGRGESQANGRKRLHQRVEREERERREVELREGEEEEKRKREAEEAEWRQWVRDWRYVEVQ